MFRRAMDYLGLGDDGSYDDYQDEPQNEQDFGRDMRDDRFDHGLQGIHAAKRFITFIQQPLSVHLHKSYRTHISAD